MDEIGKHRLDEYLVLKGLAPSRSRARDAIVRGTVHVDSKCVTKPGLSVRAGQAITINDPAAAYVSRAALKLVAALSASRYDATDAVALDIGASTGGFTQVLLQAGARTVIAIDVGHDQLHESVRNDGRVIVREGLNARHLSAGDIGEEQINFIVSDVSFISLKLALPAALNLAQSGARCILLVKPQFEVGRDSIGKGGIVSAEKGAQCANDLSAWLALQTGWHVDGMIACPISGSDGNQEYLLWGYKQ